jgi:hypothetical protein
MENTVFVFYIDNIYENSRCLYYESCEIHEYVAWQNIYIGCPTPYRNRHFFNNFTTGWRTDAPCCNN